jgi:hypothetical protein
MSVPFKIPDNQCRNLNWKIRSVRERKCSGNINSPSGYQQHRRKYEVKIVMKVRVLKLKCVNSTLSGSLEFLWLIYDSSNHIMYCDVCRKLSIFCLIQGINNYQRTNVNKRKPKLCSILIKSWMQKICQNFQDNKK